MSSADERIINRLQRIYDAQGAGGAAFAELTGEPTDNAALGSALDGKVPTSRTVNGQALSGNVVVTGRMLDTAGAPDNGVGANGDYAFDDATKTIYGPKAAGVWPAGVVLGATSSGGVIGTASWDASGGSVASLVNDGIITGVAYSGIGDFAVTISVQPNANYIVVISSYRVSGNGVTCNYSAKGTTSFNVETYDPRSEVMADPGNVNVAVLRLSQ